MTSKMFVNRQATSTTVHVPYLWILCSTVFSGRANAHGGRSLSIEWGTWYSYVDWLWSHYSNLSLQSNHDQHICINLVDCVCICYNKEFLRSFVIASLFVPSDWADDANQLLWRSIMGASDCRAAHTFVDSSACHSKPFSNFKAKTICVVPNQAFETSRRMLSWSNDILLTSAR